MTTNTTNTKMEKYKNTTFMIFIMSDKNPRTINHYQNSRTNYEKFEVRGLGELREKVNELRARGERITEVCTELGAYVSPSILD